MELRFDIFSEPRPLAFSGENTDTALKQ